MDRFVNIAVPKELSGVSEATDKGKELERWFRNVLAWHSCKTVCFYICTSHEQASENMLF